MIDNTLSGCGIVWDRKEKELIFHENVINRDMILNDTSYFYKIVPAHLFGKISLMVVWS